MPQEIEACKTWLSAFWSIWFCHELRPVHCDVLNASMHDLIEMSKSTASWSDINNPLNKIVKFSSPHTIDTVRQKWITWLNRTIDVKSVKQMNEARCVSNQKCDNKKLVQDIIEEVALPFPPEHSAEKMEVEIIEYLKSGNAYVEKFLGVTVPCSSNTSVNLTFYEREDGKYTLHYESVPYRCFFHSLPVSLKQIRACGVLMASEDKLLIDDEYFESKPLLSNSMQQFSLWLRSSSLILQEAATADSTNISFTFDNSDAIDFCHNLQVQSPTENSEKTYDLIYTSNLIDSLTAPNLLLSALPLIRFGGFIFTTSLCYKAVASTADEYLQKVFGMDIKLLPELLGIRCINHEGENYCSSVSIRPTFPHERRIHVLLIWEKIFSLPMKHPSLLKSTNISNQLCKVFCNTTPSLLTNHVKGRLSMNSLCTETAMHILHSFAERLDCDIQDEHFWQPLSNALLQQYVLIPYMHCIQTQSLLHGFHIHLVLDKSTCPVCQGVPLVDRIRQFSIKFNAKVNLLTPRFLIFVHDSQIKPDHLLQHIKGYNNELPQSTMHQDVHIIDSLNGHKTKDLIELHFYLPTSFLNKSYNVSVFGFEVCGYFDFWLQVIQYNSHSLLFTQALGAVEKMEATYIFRNTIPPIPTPESSLGKVVRHSSNGVHFETVINLSDEALSSLQSKPLSTRNLSSSNIEIFTHSHKFVVRYPFQVDYDGMSIKLSRQKKTVTIVAQRKKYAYQHEAPLFVANPSDNLTHRPTVISAENIHYFCAHQFTKNEVEYGKRHTLQDQNPFANLRQSFMIMFRNINESTFGILTVDKVFTGLIVVENRLFDLELKTPALHIAFCFVESKVVAVIHERLQAFSGEHMHLSIFACESELELMKETLSYFAQRTIPLELSSTVKLQMLDKLNIYQYFRQAVVYPLYLNHTDLSEVSDIARSNDLPQCHNCSTCSDDLKACLGCHKTKYCSKECQIKHWKIHKKECKNSTQTVEAQISEPKSVSQCIKSHSRQELHPNNPLTVPTHCSACEKEHSALRRCPCHKAAYCSITCQRMDWEKHKSNCTRKSTTSKSS